MVKNRDQTIPGLDKLYPSENTDCKTWLIADVQELARLALGWTLSNSQNVWCLSGPLNFSTRGCQLKPRTSPIQLVSIIPRLAHLKLAKPNIHWEQGSAQAPREIRGSSETEQISFLKEEDPGEHLRDKDHKSTVGLRAHYGCLLWFLIS